MNMIYLLLLFVFEVGLTLNGICPPGAVKSPTSNVCYSFSSTPTTSYQAQIHCTDQSGNLVNVDSQITNMFLISNAAKQNWDDFWIGAILTKVYNDAGVTKIWEWEGLDKLVKYDDWGFNEPSNKGGCGAAKTSDGTWFAEDCSVKKNYACSIPMKINVCDDEWDYFSVTGFCYKVFFHSDWTTAESNCVAQGAHLVSLHSKQEQNFIQDISHCGINPGDRSGSTLIGLYTTTNDNTKWIWSDGTVTDYVAWGAGQPDLPGREKCTIIYSDQVSDIPAGIWNNIACDAQHRNYVCKKLPVQVEIK